MCSTEVLCQSLNPDLIMGRVICDFSFLHENEACFGGDIVIIYVPQGHCLSHSPQPVVMVYVLAVTLNSHV